MAFKIVGIDKRHIRQIVEAHMEAFPVFFLTFLGPRFLGEFYKSFTYDGAGVGFVAANNK